MSRPRSASRDRLGTAPLLMLTAALALVLAVLDHHPPVQAAALAASTVCTGLALYQLRKK